MFRDIHSKGWCGEPSQTSFFMICSGNKDCKEKKIVERVVEFNNTIALQVTITCHVLNNVLLMDIDTR